MPKRPVRIMRAKQTKNSPLNNRSVAAETRRRGTLILYDRLVDSLVFGLRRFVRVIDTMNVRKTTAAAAQRYSEIGAGRAYFCPKAWAFATVEIQKFAAMEVAKK
jgi:hypothetical protein